jgi:NAD(P)-dependent dehydrogenase (short-subunit alcohol dehydrogenase family)
MDKVAVVTGASSGVGKAVALKLASRGWKVAVLARRADALADVVRSAGKNAGNLLPVVCDVSNPESIRQMADVVLARFGHVDALVNSAGTNTPDRAWKTLSLATYRNVMETNVTGTYSCIQAFLPSMRQSGSGTIVNIVSDSAIQASAKSGAAYATSKYAVRGMTQSLNAEERGNGIRAIAIYPGDIDTPLLDRRPTPPTAEQRKLMLQPDDVADCVLLAIELPGRAVIEEMLIRPR